MLSPIRHAYQLFKKSLQALAPMKRFLILPSLCAVLDILILAAILSPLHRLEMLQQPLSKLQWEYFALFFGLYLIFLYITHLLFYFSYATLLNGLNAQILGEKPHLSKALAMTLKQYPAIFRWVTFASTVGFFYRFTHPRIAGQRWSIATYLILPVLLEGNLGARASLQRSADLMTQTWGAPVRARFQISALLFYYFFLSLIPLLIALLINTTLALIIGAVISAILFMIMSLLYVSARTLLVGNFYHYALDRNNIFKQDPELLQYAFIQTNDGADKQ